nr:hypothetical protein [uncultured Thiodictyon sp.]
MSAAEGMINASERLGTSRPACPAPRKFEDDPRYQSDNYHPRNQEGHRRQAHRDALRQIRPEVGRRVADGRPEAMISQLTQRDVYYLGFNPLGEIGALPGERLDFRLDIGQFAAHLDERINVLCRLTAMKVRIRSTAGYLVLTTEPPQLMPGLSRAGRRLLGRQAPRGRGTHVLVRQTPLEILDLKIFWRQRAHHWFRGEDYHGGNRQQ